MKRWDLECVDGCLVSKQRVKHDIKKDKTLGNHTQVGEDSHPRKVTQNTK